MQRLAVSLCWVLAHRAEVSEKRHSKKKPPPGVGGCPAEEAAKAVVEGGELKDQAKRISVASHDAFGLRFLAELVRRCSGPRPQRFHAGASDPGDPPSSNRGGSDQPLPWYRP